MGFLGNLPSGNRAAAIHPPGFDTEGKDAQGSVEQVKKTVKKWGRNTGALRGSRRGRSR